MTNVKFVDLFAGLGGMRIGFTQALNDIGLEGECVFSSEVKPYAVQTYTHNFQEQVSGDITVIDEKNIPDFDFLLAGFPCQAFSTAGKRLGFSDVRGTLFFDIVRILDSKKPSGFLLENVEGLIAHDNGHTLSVILKTLTNLGYTVSHTVLDGKDFGLAQTRKRIYICGVKNAALISLIYQTQHKTVLGDIIDYETPPIETEFTKKLFSHFNINQIIGKQIKDKRGGDGNIHSWDFALKGEINEEQRTLLELILRQRRNKKWAEVYNIDWMDGMPLTLKMIETFYKSKNLKTLLSDLVDKNYLVLEHPKMKVNGKREYATHLEKGYNIVTGKLSFEFNRILDPNEIVPTLVATDVSRLAVPVNGGIRPLTIREGLRLFGFPETYSMPDISNKDAFDLLGNTVCIPVIRSVSKEIVSSVLEI